MRSFIMSETQNMVNFSNFNRINIDKLFHPNDTFNKAMEVRMTQLYVLEKYKIILAVSFNNENFKPESVTLEDFNVDPSDYKEKLEFVWLRYLIGTKAEAKDKFFIDEVISFEDVVNEVDKDTIKDLLFHMDAFIETKE